MGQTYSTKATNHTLKMAALSMVILLAAGCSDSKTLDSTTDNQQGTGTEVAGDTVQGGDKGKELPDVGTDNSESGTDESQGSGSGGSNTGESVGDNTDGGSEGSGTEGNNEEGKPSGDGDSSSDGSGTGDGSTDTPPTEGGDVDAGQLSYIFHRDPPKKDSTEPLVNQEMVGRSFDFSIYQKAEDGFGLEEVTDKVTWTALSEQCGEVSCYKVAEDKTIKGTHKGAFTLVAEYMGQVTPPINFVTGEKLEACPSGQTSIDGKPCLAVVEQTFGEGLNVIFTEPPRDMTMELLGYKLDEGRYNTGYSHSGFEKSSGNNYARMTNEGYVPGIDSHRLVAGDFGQHDRYCKDLKEMEFKGRNDWRRPYAHELEQLARNFVAAGNGWPEGDYAAANFSAGKVPNIAYVNMVTGRTTYRTVDVISSPVCASGNSF